MPVQTHAEILMTIFGGALCLGGWVIFYFGTRLVGLGMGLGAGYLLGEGITLAVQLKGSEQDMAVLVCCLLGAVAGLFLIRAATAFLFFVMGFLFGALLGRLGSQIWLIGPGQPFAFTSQTITAILVSAMVLGILAAWLQRFVIIIITSFVGANFLVAGIAYLRQVELAGFAAAFALAVAWQVLFVTNLVKPSRRRRPEGDD